MKTSTIVIIATSSALVLGGGLYFLLRKKTDKSGTGNIAGLTDEDLADLADEINSDNPSSTSSTEKKAKIRASIALLQAKLTRLEGGSMAWVNALQIKTIKEQIAALMAQL